MTSPSTNSGQFLLDTNAFIWFVLGLGLGNYAKKELLAADNIYVSSISILEMHIKASKGKLPTMEKIINMAETLQLDFLPLNHKDLKDYRMYNPANLDPFDNTLISIAKAHNLILVTSDKAILSLPSSTVETIDARK